jgi:L-amino acid N-acyltransferase YncA
MKSRFADSEPKLAVASALSAGLGEQISALAKGAGMSRRCGSLSGQVVDKRRRYLAPMSIIREATDADWPQIFPFYAAIVADGKTYAFPEAQTLEQARPWWMEQAPSRTVVACDGDTIVGSAKMGPNRPGRGSHVATASFMVDPAHQGRGVGRELGQYVLDWARAAGFRAIQFNAVVETNAAAVHLWRSLGLEILATAPESFNHPTQGLVGLHLMFRRL